MEGVELYRSDGRTVPAGVLDFRKDVDRPI